MARGSASKLKAKRMGLTNLFTISMLGPPPGIGAAHLPFLETVIGAMQLTASGGSPIREWSIVLLATTDIGYGPIQVAVSFFTLSVKEQLFAFEFAKTMAEQGKTGRCNCWSEA